MSNLNNKLKNITLICSIVLASCLGGCATIITGENEDIYIDTTPVNNAKCTLSNSRGTWHINETPGITNVKRSMSNLNVNCTKGEYTGIRSISTSVKSSAAGNLIMGGVIGAGIDAVTGSAFDYPENIIITMHKKS